MNSFWMILIGFLLLVFITDWFKNTSREAEFQKQKRLLQSYISTAEKNYPDLVNKPWNPKRYAVKKDLRRKVFTRTKGRCFYCDISLQKIQKWQVDHVWPYRYGGSEEFINLVASCLNCNQEKWSYLPPRYYLHKWVIGKTFTSHEVNFLNFYRNNSMSNLIGTSAHWKGRADYWSSSFFADFIDLILNNKSIKSSIGKEREELIKKAQEIYIKLDCDITNRFHNSYSAIQDWLDTDKWLAEFMKNYSSTTRLEVDPD